MRNIFFAMMLSLIFTSIAWAGNAPTGDFIVNSGNVGVGTAHPERLLHVKNSTLVPGFFGPETNPATITTTQQNNASYSRYADGHRTNIWVVSLHQADGKTACSEAEHTWDPFEDNNSHNNYRLNISWDAVSDATGYIIMINDQGAQPNINAYKVVSAPTTSTIYDTTSGWTVTDDAGSGFCSNIFHDNSEDTTTYGNAVMIDGYSLFGGTTFDNAIGDGTSDEIPFVIKVNSSDYSDDEYYLPLGSVMIQDNYDYSMLLNGNEINVINGGYPDTLYIGDYGESSTSIGAGAGSSIRLEGTTYVSDLQMSRPVRAPSVLAGNPNLFNYAAYEIELGYMSMYDSSNGPYKDKIIGVSSRPSYFYEEGVPSLRLRGGASPDPMFEYEISNPGTGFTNLTTNDGDDNFYYVDGGDKNWIIEPSAADENGGLATFGTVHIGSGYGLGTYDVKSINCTDCSWTGTGAQITITVQHNDYSDVSNMSGGNIFIESGRSNGTGSSYIAFLTTTAGASGYVSHAPTEKMRILGNGNVAIGTTVAASTLTVNGDISFNGQLSSGGVGVSSFDGNVGIGSSNPTHKLEVYGSFYQNKGDCNQICRVGGVYGCKDTGSCIPDN